MPGVAIESAPMSWSLRSIFARRERRTGGRRRLLAVLPFRDEMRFLPGWFANVLRHVDGVVALDDGSRDGSADFVAHQPKVLALLRSGRQPEELWDCGANRRRLFAAAGECGAQWIVGLDADERIEREFRLRAEAEIDRLEGLGIGAGAIRIRELWDRPDRMRVDGIWGQKAHGRLFSYRPEAVLDERRFHGHWPPLDSQLRHPDGREYFEPLDLEIYHLRMVRAEDRAGRRERYNRLDPERRFQAIGYDYLTDPQGLVVSPLPEGREYEPIPESV